MFDEEGVNNPILEYVEKRSNELVQKASMDTFHRMRVTEKLFLAEHRMDPSIANDRNELTNWAKTIVEKENDQRQASISEFDKDPKKAIDIRMWEEPFDTSQEVIADGVKWYLEMRKDIHPKDTMVTKSFADLTLNLYKAGVAEEGTQLLIDPSTKRFSDLVVDIASYKYKDVAKMAAEKDIVGGDDSPHNAGSGEPNVNSMFQFEQNNEEALGRFKQSVQKLGTEFDKIYNSRIGQASEV